MVTRGNSSRISSSVVAAVVVVVEEELGRRSRRIAFFSVVATWLHVACVSVCMMSMFVHVPVCP